MTKMVLVVAIQKGFYHGLRDVGEEFEVNESELDESPRAWFKPVKSVSQDADMNSNYSRMNKEQLTQTAIALGLGVNNDMTKAQIIELLTAE